MITFECARGHKVWATPAPGRRLSGTWTRCSGCGERYYTITERGRRLLHIAAAGRTDNYVVAEAGWRIRRLEAVRRFPDDAPRRAALLTGWLEFDDWYSAREWPGRVPFRVALLCFNLFARPVECVNAGVWLTVGLREWRKSRRTHA